MELSPEFRLQLALSTRHATLGHDSAGRAILAAEDASMVPRRVIDDVLQKRILAFLGSHAPERLDAIAAEVARAPHRPSMTPFAMAMIAAGVGGPTVEAAVARSGRLAVLAERAGLSGVPAFEQRLRAAIGDVVKYGRLTPEQVGPLADFALDGVGSAVEVAASTRDKDLDWMARQGSRYGVTLSERRDYAMVAVQGPKARERVHGLLSADGAARAAKLGKFVAADVDGLFVARTGYTGEDGYEIMVPEAEAVSFWNRLVAGGVKPCGLGVRDTLRLEAGMNLYGQDMDETVSPREAALAWTLALEPAERDFIGRDALIAQKAGGAAREMIGLVLDDKGVLRHGQRVVTDRGDGEILSGSFSPTLGKSIAFARVPAGAAGGLQAYPFYFWR